MLYFRSSQVPLRAFLLIAFPGLGVVGCSSPEVTFTRDVAPILFENCSDCHRPGGSGPFSLLEYASARNRAGQIADVTSRRVMPPWLPQSGGPDFVGERRLSQEQILTLRRWAEQGAPQGAPEDLPAPPDLASGWRLGEPDLVLEQSVGYPLAEEGRDVFRNFVFPVPVSERRYIRALEIRPGNERVVHHANVLVDRSGVSLRLDEQDPGVGFAGMELTLESETFEPQTHFLFWKPGSDPTWEPRGMTWEVNRRTHLVLNMHFQPSGKPESIRPSLALYFSDEPPSRFPMLLQLENDAALDIPPGVSDFRVSDQLVLPVDVRVLGVYPHAHYLGRKLEASAALPGGTRHELISIPDWDFNWQGVFRYKTPLFLPAGTRLSMEYHYDNSTDNPRNPHNPPQRVMAGNQSSDEMAHLWLQVLPERREDRLLLQEALMLNRLEKAPADPVALTNLGAVLQARGDLAGAIELFRRAIRARPDDATALNNLGAALRLSGRMDEAIENFRAAVSARPDYFTAHYNLGTSLLTTGQPGRAVLHFERVVGNDQEDLAARRNLALASALAGRFEKAESNYKHLIGSHPDDPELHGELAVVLAQRGRMVEARRHFERLLEVSPNSAPGHTNLGRLLAQQGDVDAALPHLREAVRLDGANADNHNQLGVALAIKGDIAQATRHFQRALDLEPSHREARENLRRALGQD